MVKNFEVPNTEGLVSSEDEKITISKSLLIKMQNWVADSTFDREGSIKNEFGEFVVKLENFHGSPNLVTVANEDTIVTLGSTEFLEITYTE